MVEGSEYATRLENDLILSIERANKVTGLMKMVIGAGVTLILVGFSAGLYINSVDARVKALESQAVTNNRLIADVADLKLEMAKSNAILERVESRLNNSEEQK